MKQAEMAEVLTHLHKEEMVLRGAGQAEYAHGAQDNAFNNFERVAALTGCSREQVLMVYALKHIDGIMAWVKGHRSQREDVRGRINDARLYLALLRGMIDEEGRTEGS